MRRKVNVYLEDFRTIVISAFRYTLGRKTYITGMMAETIIKYKDALTTLDKEQIKRDIREALASDRAGMNMDREEWIHVLDILEESE